MFGADTVEFEGTVYNARHGGAFDRGAADSYYHRPRRPHRFEGATYTSVEILLEPTDPDYWDYLAGYDYNEQFGDKKDWF